MVEEFIKFLEEHEALDYYYNTLKNAPKSDGFIYFGPFDWLMESFRWRLCPKIDWCELYLKWNYYWQTHSIAKESHTFNEILQIIEEYKRKNDNLISIF